MNGIRPPRSALIVTLRFLGDALLSTPLVRALKQRFPDCDVDVLVFSGTQGVFEGNRDVRRVIAVPELASAGDTLQRVRGLWRRYDLAVIAQTGTRPFLFGWAAGRQRIGLVSPEWGKSWWKRALLDRHAVFDPRGARVLENQRIVQLLGIDDMPGVVAPSAGWRAPEVGSALGFDPAAEPFAVLHLAPRWRYKQWTAAGWHAVIDALISRQLRVVVSGGPGAEERAYVDSVLQDVEPGRVTRRDGRLTLAQTADVLRLAALYIGPDTATTHLAAACGTPVVALYGPTDPAIWGPWPARAGRAYERVAPQQRRGNVLLLQNPDLACVPCQLEGCERHRGSHSECLDRLPAERVIDAAALLLRSGE
ncbi:MAG TPA: glycosyltransferase family 9 protein [Burkholderiaceae bacterium]|nr:glycosyltransferase family 9 protein [Burkholderiaceae bacterium]HQR75589.1 glycosyltransferase family 9 protein [Burkholderiaceae bacterium]